MIEYLAAGLGILGALLVAFKKRSGFMCWIRSIVVQFTIFWFVAVFGFWNWKRNV